MIRYQVTNRAHTVEIKFSTHPAVIPATIFAFAVAGLALGGPIGAFLLGVAGIFLAPIGWWVVAVVVGLTLNR
jgi:hypothetical protein